MGRVLGEEGVQMHAGQAKVRLRYEGSVQRVRGRTGVLSERQPSRWKKQLKIVGGYR